jgi:hypothetical protein
MGFSQQEDYRIELECMQRPAKNGYDTIRG